MDRRDQQLQTLGVEKKPVYTPLMRLFEKARGVSDC